ncbi:hypothetical protein L228DRAFT_235530 [Xylona heveae TC161]|uniref:Uncharacterized protein n=1 Tax=Xylona heveae (strain CBS 132557 / TC161) TaxID=1328760 RepID=A0A165JNU5_XYLHT|nr:hypothetical protein L228DRAFT_235530 [Xylona heveae TC161]KZF26462.1 hypothetical protein L228DRAFT_235530 [Xylona heveae TC161]
MDIPLGFGMHEREEIKKMQAREQGQLARERELDRRYWDPSPSIPQTCDSQKVVDLLNEFCNLLISMAVVPLDAIKYYSEQEPLEKAQNSGDGVDLVLPEFVYDPSRIEQAIRQSSEGASVEYDRRKGYARNCLKTIRSHLRREAIYVNALKRRRLR